MASQVRFEPQGRDGLVAFNTTLSAAAERLGVDIPLACGGRGECTTCAVRVLDGALADVTDAERRQLGERLSEGVRLACQAHIGHDDCRIEVLPQPAGEAGTTAPPAGESGTASEARDQLRDAFNALPTTEQIVATLELQWQVASDLFGRLLETPFKLGEQMIGSLLGQPPAAPQNQAPEDQKPADPSDPEAATEAAAAEPDTPHPTPQEENEAPEADPGDGADESHGQS